MCVCVCVCVCEKGEEPSKRHSIKAELVLQRQLVRNTEISSPSPGVLALAHANFLVVLDSSFGWKGLLKGFLFDNSQTFAILDRKLIAV